MADLLTLTPPMPGAAQLQCETDTGIATIPLADEVSFGSWQRGIPEAYWSLDAEELTARIGAARKTLGTRAVILGQDPYPTPGDANGLAFSFVGSGRLPASLKVILAEALLR